MGIGVSGALLLAVATTASMARAQQCAPVSSVERVSIAGNGDQANDRSVIPTLNANGCVVGFKSYASNLVTGDNNEKVDVFVRDREAATTERIPPVGFTGAESKDNSYPPGLDASGSIVAFGSLSNNLAPNDFNQVADVFVYDRLNQSTRNLSLALGGEGGGGVPDLQPSVSADGILVVFTALSDNLLPLIDKNQANDVFLADLSSGALELISQTTTGSEPGTAGNGPSAGGVISADGCHVAFYSDASNIVAQDKNEFRDVFVRDRCGDVRTERVNVASDGTAANRDSQASGFLPGISGDGNRVAFSSDATNLDPADDNSQTDIFVRDRTAGQTIRVSKNQNGDSANGPSQYPSISADGRFVAFQSDASNLVAGDTNQSTDIFVVEVDTGDIRRLSVSGSGTEGNGNSTFPGISADGTTVVFQSDATNLVDGDTNGASDIFIVSNPLVGGPTPTPTAGDSCGAVCSVGQGCRREVSGEIQPGECVPDQNCLCIVGGTASPTASVTPTGPTPTPTAGDSCGAVCSVGQGCRRQVGGVIVPGECVPDENCLCIVGGTATPTPSVTPTPPPTFTSTPCSMGTPCSLGFSKGCDANGCNCFCEGPTFTATVSPTMMPSRTPTTSATTGGGKGGGGGCGCRIDPTTGRVADSTPFTALALPAAVWFWRRRQRRF
jgi:Tol biopolymer transport system component